MNNVYSLLKLNRSIKSVRIKNLGIYLLHLLGKRYYGVFLDPVFACNLRCKMCYFTDDAVRKAKQSRPFTPDEIQRIADAFFHRALKLQIGCGAEPSLFQHNTKIIRLAKEKKVPYISMTTNANLFQDADWEDLLAAGLDEVTLSLHGIRKESYEYFMTNGSYEAFRASLSSLTRLKTKYPHFKIRVNYTINNDNLEELTAFFDVFRTDHFDILQFRPIQRMGDTAYGDFSWDALIDRYDAIIEPLRQQAKALGITFIAPLKHDLLKEDNQDGTIADSTYIYLSSRSCWEDDFDLQTDTYESYARRTGLGGKLFRRVFQSGKKKKGSKKQLNYSID